jgi:hypothetical protein
MVIPPGDSERNSGNRHKGAETPKLAPDLELHDPGSVLKRGPHRIKHDVADADKVARTGGREERVRDTPPAGAWNDASAD